jgi:hypothetical protein
MVKEKALPSPGAGIFPRPRRWNAEFVDIVPGQAEEIADFPEPDPLWKVNGQSVRKVEPIDTQNVINAVFNHTLFWYGRAQNIFNGVNPHGDRDADAFVLQASGPTTELERVQVRLENSALASQSLSALFSTTAESYMGRTGPKVGKKMLSLTPLAKQQVHPEDSVLADFSRSASRSPTRS